MGLNARGFGPIPTSFFLPDLLPALENTCLWFPGTEAVAFNVHLITIPSYSVAIFLSPFESRR